MNTKQPWCEIHNRPATHTNHLGMPCCDPKLGGILFPCVIDPDTCQHGNTRLEHSASGNESQLVCNICGAAVTPME